jgi:hypothetical protein
MQEKSAGIYMSKMAFKVILKVICGFGMSQQAL